MNKKDIISFNDKGVLHGCCKSYHLEGHLWAIENYMNGKPHGMSSVWYRNGNLEHKGKYINNLKTGYWLYHSNDNQPIKKQYFII